MTEYLLDTNHVSPIVTIGHPLRKKILEHLNSGGTFSLPTPALSEFLYGIMLLPRVKQNLQEWQRFKHDFKYYAINHEDAEQSAELRVALRSKGWQLGIIDSFIAVIALRNDLTLLTSDKDFTAVPGLKQENWR